jgi:dienelactone hydrolase
MKTLCSIAAAAALFALAPAQKPESFEVKTDDGFTIHGDLLNPKKKDVKSALVVFIHDAKGKRTQFSDAALKFYRAGFATVTFDLRGHNQSDKKDGRPVAMDKDEDWKFTTRDLRAVKTYCGEQAGIDTDRIVYVGAGFGAAMALKAAAADDGAKGFIGLSTPIAQPFTKDDCAKPVKAIALKVPMLLYTGKQDDDKNAAKSLGVYAKESSAKVFDVKNLPNDVRGADLVAVKPSIADEMVAWLKKNGVEAGVKVVPEKK